MIVIYHHNNIISSAVDDNNQPILLTKSQDMVANIIAIARNNPTKNIVWCDTQAIDYIDLDFIKK